MAEIQSDYDLLLARVASGELGAGNLVEMILNERAAYARATSDMKQWQLKYNRLQAWVITAHTPLPENEDTVNLVELILWLALPWGENDPLFPESDGWTPAALAANVRMKATWQRVVRNPSLGAVPDEERQ